MTHKYEALNSLLTRNGNNILNDKVMSEVYGQF
jgi:hypothetical protein